MIISLGNVITGFTLGDVADELLTWFDEYDNDTKTEGTDKTNGRVDLSGTSAEQDIIQHFVVTIYGFLVLLAISIGGNAFSDSFFANLFDDGFGVTSASCDVTLADASLYSGLQALV